MKRAAMYQCAGRAYERAIYRDSQRSIARTLVFALLLTCPALAVADDGSLVGRKAVAVANEAWVVTGNMSVPRTGHTATRLLNGKVLVVGGSGDSNTPLDSAELYDPVSGTWSMTGHLSAPRLLHTATLLADGRILVAGGQTSAAPPVFGRTNSAELYDPFSGTWTRTANLGAPRSWHTATLLNNGKVLVAGGFSSDSLGTAELYDPVSSTWSATGSFSPRYGHTASLLEDGRVLVAGGSNDGDLASTLATVDVYNPVAGTWSAAPDLVVSEFSHTATLLKSGQILITGGYMPRFLPFAAPVSLNTAQHYDPATARWALSESLLAIRDNHTATLLRDGRVIIVGGEAWQGQYPQIVHQTIGGAETYDPAGGGWSAASSLGTARGGHTATLLTDGRVLVAGGNNGGVLRSAELYGDAIAPSGSIGPAMTGAWYDPVQNGHGLLIEVLPGNRIYAAWFAFDPAGTQQAWFTGVGTYSGNIATITDVSRPIGGRWIPNFDPAQIGRTRWGSLTFTFTDCDHGRVDFVSTAGFGSGSMNLTRLTQPLGLSCP